MESQSPKAEYTSVQTPKCVKPDIEAKSSQNGTYNQHHFFKQILWVISMQCFIIACVGVFLYGHMAYWTPTFQLRLKEKIGAWWDVPSSFIGYFLSSTAPGHQEMIRPTYFLLFCFVPLLASVLLIEWISRPTLYRVSSQYLMQAGTLLRRRPVIWNKTKLCWYTFGELFLIFLLTFGNCWAYSYAYTRSRLYQHTLSEPLTKSQYLEALSVGFGYVSVFNLAFLYIFITRNHAWMEFLGISYPNAVKYHRWIGTIAIVTAIIHFVVYCIAYIREKKLLKMILPCWNCSLGSTEGKEIWVNVFGGITLLLFLTIGITSIPWFRRRKYAIFYSVHQLFTIAMITLVMHFAGSVWWIIPSVLLYLTTRAISFCNGRSSLWIDAIGIYQSSERDGILELVIVRSTGKDGEYETGQFVYLNVPAISQLEWHPFTIASSPATDPQRLTLLIKPLGTWTQRLVEHLNECETQECMPVMHLDGFYGASLRPFFDHPTLCMVTGGIGVTPAIPILEDILKQNLLSNDSHEIFFIFGFREIELLHQLSPLLQRLREADLHQRFHTYLFWTLASNSTLDKPLNYSPHSIQPHNYRKLPNARNDMSNKSAHRPFGNALQGAQCVKCIVHVSTFLVAVLCIGGVEYNSQYIKKHAPNLWPLQRCAAGIIMYLCILIPFFAIYLWQRTEAITPLTEMKAQWESVNLDILTYRDLLHHFNAQNGRPTIDSIFDQMIAKSPQLASTSRPSISVLVSGPESLEKTVQKAVVDRGSKHFRVFSEEFNL